MVQLNTGVRRDAMKQIIEINNKLGTTVRESSGQIKRKTSFQPPRPGTDDREFQHPQIS